MTKKTQTKEQFCRELAGRKDMLGEAYKNDEDFVRKAVSYYNHRGRGIFDIIDRWRMEDLKSGFKVQLPLITYIVLIFFCLVCIKFLLT